MRGRKLAVKPVKLKETQIELQVCHLLRAKNIFFWKQPSRGYWDAKRKVFRRDVNPFVGRGVPDIIFLIDGHFCSFEIKSEKGVQSEDQKTFETRCKAAGAFYFLIRSVEEAESVLKLLDAYFEKHSRGEC